MPESCNQRGGRGPGTYGLVDWLVAQVDQQKFHTKWIDRDAFILEMPWIRVNEHGSTDNHVFKELLLAYDNQFKGRSTEIKDLTKTKDRFRNALKQCDIHRLSTKGEIGRLQFQIRNESKVGKYRFASSVSSASPNSMGAPSPESYQNSPPSVYEEIEIGDQGVPEQYCHQVSFYENRLPHCAPYSHHQPRPRYGQNYQWYFPPANGQQIQGQCSPPHVSPEPQYSSPLSPSSSYNSQPSPGSVNSADQFCSLPSPPGCLPSDQSYPHPCSYFGNDPLWSSTTPLTAEELTELPDLGDDVKNDLAQLCGFHPSLFENPGENMDTGDLYLDETISKFVVDSVSAVLGMDWEENPVTVDTHVLSSMLEESDLVTAMSDEQYLREKGGDTKDSHLVPPGAPPRAMPAVCGFAQVTPEHVAGVFLYVLGKRRATRYIGQEFPSKVFLHGGKTRPALAEQCITLDVELSERECSRPKLKAMTMLVNLLGRVTISVTDAGDVQVMKTGYTNLHYRVGTCGSPKTVQRNKTTTIWTLEDTCSTVQMSVGMPFKENSASGGGFPLGIEIKLSGTFLEMMDMSGDPLDGAMGKLSIKS